MKITNLKNAVKVPFKIDGHVMFSGKDVELIHLTLKAGENLDLHANPFDVVFFVVSGEGVLDVEGERLTMRPNDTIEVKKDILRAWENNSAENLRILVLKMINSDKI
jgi:quercetin dioxygenase-like cupin family protein